LIITSQRIREPRLSAALFAILLVVSGCAAPERSARRSASPRQSEPQPGGTLVRRLTQDPNTLNLLLVNFEHEKQVLSYVYDPLLDLDGKMNLIPGLAEKWEVSPDGKTYTFWIDPRATWSDGQPVRASDVVFTLKKIVDPATQAAELAPLFAGLDTKETRALDDRTARVVFKRARPAQIYAFNMGILPEHEYKKGSFPKELNWKAVGNGPYVVTRHDRGKEILLTRRQDYQRNKPYIERVLFKVLADDAVAWNAMKRGDIDETRITADTWKLERNEPTVQQMMAIHLFYGLGYNFIAWNNQDPILKDGEARRAMTMAMDRRKIVNTLYHGSARLISGPFTPDQPAYNHGVKPIEFDPKGARALLESIGWRDSDRDGVLDRDGKKFELETIFRAGNAPSLQQLQVLQNDLRTIGVVMNLTPVDDATLIPRVLNGKYQGVYLSWSLDLDPDLYSLFHSSQKYPAGQNFVFYSNKEADRLIEQARTEMDEQKRNELYRQLHAVIAEDQPYTFTFQVAEKWTVNRRVKNARSVNGLGLFDWYPGKYEWWIPEAQQRAAATQ
jgi:peptide/nickel transport system substrate-binding protein